MSKNQDDEIDCYSPGKRVDEFKLWRYRARWNSAEGYKAERAGDHQAAARYREAARIYRKFMENRRRGGPLPL